MLGETTVKTEIFYQPLLFSPHPTTLSTGVVTHGGNIKNVFLTHSYIYITLNLYMALCAYAHTLTQAEGGGDWR